MPEASITFSPKPASVGMARRFLAETLESWDLHGLDYEASVVLSELVTNGVLHAGTELVVTLRFDGTVVRLEVEDGSPLEPAFKHPTSQATTGRGLLLVSSLSTGWGFSATPAGKVVWAEFDGVGTYRSEVAGARFSSARSDKPGAAPRSRRPPGLSSSAMRGRSAA